MKGEKKTVSEDKQNIQIKEKKMNIASERNQERNSFTTIPRFCLDSRAAICNHFI